MLGRFAAEQEGVPARIHTYHGHTFEQYFRGPFAALNRGLERQAARKSHAIICQSESQAKDISKTLGSATDGRIIMIPPAIEDIPGLDRAAARSLVLSQLGAKDKDLLLVLPARLAPVKQPQVAVEVAASLAKRCAGTVHLVILGDGPLRPLVVDAAENYASEGLYVHILPPVTEPWRFFAAADLVFLTSRMEGTPLALLEALALGSPVAAPDVGGVADILSGLGLVLPALHTPESSPERWAELIHEDLRRRSAQGQEQHAMSCVVRERYRKQRMLEQVADLYRRLLRCDGGA
jgi:glycosyltransferase involved in cell wall biosynthesis